MTPELEAIDVNAKPQTLAGIVGDEESRLRIEAESLREQLSARKDALTTVEADWHEFRSRYMDIVGRRYAELEQVETLIAEAEGAHAAPAADEPEPTGEETDDANVGSSAHADEGFQPLRQMRKLFWRVARMFHPDLARDEIERQRRHDLMTEANRAYESGDAERLTSLLADEDETQSERRDPIVSERLGALRAEVARLRRELRHVEAEIKRITDTDFFYLKVKTDEAAHSGRDLLSEMAARVAEQVTNARRRLEELR